MPLTSTDDPLFAQQWFLENTGQTGGAPGADVNVTPVWPEYTGRGVRVAIFDDGVQGSHPDLAANFDATGGYDIALGQGGPGLPVKADDNHGTLVAGFVAEVTNNGIGGAGIAYDASIVSFRQDLSAADDNDDGNSANPEVTGFQQQLAQDVDVSNNSWGGSLIDTQDDAPGQAIEDLATNGRDGLGTVIVFAAGNERDQTNIGTATDDVADPHVIAVAATDQNGRATSFSSPGAGLLVSAPGEDVLSTDRAGTGLGFDPNADYVKENGTSFSAPMVSGVVALMLEANPLLGARDVQEILAASAVRLEGADSWMLTTDGISQVLGAELAQAGINTPDVLQSYVKPWDWQINGAGDWNGGGYHVSHDYGLGQVDAHAAVRLAESWGGSTQTFSNEASDVVDSGALNVTLPENDPNGVSYAIQFPTGAGLDVEHIGLEIEFALPAGATVTNVLNIYSQLDITLTSPSGTVSHLLTGFNGQRWLQLQDQNAPQLDINQAVDQTALQVATTSTQHWGESAEGTWTLKIADVVDAPGVAPVVVNKFGIEAQGAVATADDRYVYTDEFSALAATDPSRAVLTDGDGGNNTLNLAALTGHAEVALDGSAASLIDGIGVTFAAGTVVTNVIGGDDNDVLAGTTAANLIEGGRGNDVMLGGDQGDVLRGGAGDDRIGGGNGNELIEGGAGNDVLDGGDQGDDLLYGGAGDDALGGYAGTDYLTGNAGADRFLLTNEARGITVITDFVIGTDHLLNFTGQTTTELEVSATITDGGSTVLNLPDGQYIVLNGVDAPVTGDWFL